MIPRPSFYTLEDLQEPPERGGWGLTLDALHTLAEDGAITISLKTIRGETREGITAEEKARAEGEARNSPINRRRENTLLQLIGALAVAYSGGDSDLLDHPYSLLADIEKCAAANGAQIPAGQQTAAGALEAGIALLKARGFYRSRARATASSSAEPVTQKQAA